MKTKFNEKRICVCLALVMSAVMLSIAPCFAAPNFTAIVEPIVDLLETLLRPLMAVVGTVGSIYCILLGVKYIKAEEPQDREKAKQHLKSAIIGFILIFVLIVVLNLLMGPMMTWVENSTTVDFGAANPDGAAAGSAATGTGTSAAPATPAA